MHTGKTDYGKFAKKDTAQDQMKRVDDFGDWLEKGDAAKEATDSK